MNNLNWKDGGNKPLSYAVKCAICGEQIMVPTRDYYYAKDEETGKWVQAHAKCAIANLPKAPADEFRDHLIDELMMIREQLALMNEKFAKMIEQGAH